jgi:NDP-sugar pyrophosphorylase family protein
MNFNCIRVIRNELNNEFLKYCRKEGILTVPVLNEELQIVDVLNLKDYRDIIPVDAVIMAGGKGERLLPFTKDCPKPLLRVGEKPIIEYNLDHLARFGVKNVQISINYLGDQIESFFSDGGERGISIKYIKETSPLGTIGALSVAAPFTNDTILLMNSDLLTNIDFGDLYNEFVKSGADMAVATVPHHVDLPYGIIEFIDNTVSSLKEKPRYTYFANAGIYLMKNELLDFLPVNQFYNATDLMEKVINNGRKLIHFPILGYWLDIGRLSDFQKAQEDIKHISW